ncbi:sensor histidine kinase [Schinkia azotoformans]|uniref:sensor histidine kinase n=1 Tax=Schinkia azotoformans TaxID=1454 RepID=UPI002DB7CA4A|nr:ATP-binding protein [Schinkia azotoformans]MEC1718267.1 ATP-binding protein [Schinkia azotoformans]MEC1743717.1 ATP-binding protein [Schinkia azotoformans]MEC1747836.1 ATP-binding protein [Schinkia azotoformans]MEC1760609.1 ATP-binding protein [Schinkia azotoformans]MEC1768143.1 ATP-binding protein [Schinkia azotoformans]
MKLLSKLIFAVTTIVLLMGLFQYFYFQNQIKTEFQQFLVNQEMGIVDRLEVYFESYYESNHSFQNVEQVLESNQMMMGRRHGGMMGTPMLLNLQVLIANTKGVIIADSKQLYNGKRALEVPGIHRDLLFNNKKVGELIIIREEDLIQQNLVKQFIHSTNYTILLGTMIGSLIAVAVGFIIAKGLTKPVAKLLKGIEKVSSGDTSFRVSVQKKDEFYHLVQAFNHMTEQLAQNERLRQNLMADVAHELRTPLAIIRGKLESIQEGVIEANEKEIMLLVDEVYRLSRLVNNLQQLSLAEAGKLPLNKAPLNVNQFLDKVISNFLALTDDKNITLKKRLLIKEIILPLDEDRMTQVIVNILDNALRHTPRNGEITVLSDYDKNTGEVVITISDTGLGIDPKILPTIFDRFSRTDTSRNRDQGGTGLGLSIAKGFVEAHEGTISVTSEIGKGTSFSIRLPSFL